MPAHEGKLYYKIREVGEMLDVPMPTLRYWEKEVNSLKPRTIRGHRYYTQDDIDLIRRIIFLRDQNVPVKEWNRRLSLDRRFQDKQQAAIEQLRAIRDELLTLKSLI